MFNIPNNKEYPKIIENMSKLLAEQRYDDFIRYEVLIYSKYIKVNEKAEIHEKIFTDMEPMLVAYGEILKKEINNSNSNSNSNSNKICYLLPSLDNDLAHIETLFNILNEHDFKNQIFITVAGPAKNINKPGSVFLGNLSKSNKISLVAFTHSHKGYINFINYYIKNFYDQLIIYSIPFLLPSFLQIFNHDEVTWHTTKFELKNFEKLTNRSSFFSYRREQFVNENTIWERSLGALSLLSVPKFNANWSSEIKIISVNRPEKLKDEKFLNTISKILKIRPNTKFYWTGRIEDEYIKNYFILNKLNSQVHFLGWVDFDKTIDDFDIFIDSNLLSGALVAKAAVAGMPVLCWKGANSWIELNEQLVRSDLLLKSQEFKFEDFVFNNENLFAEHLIKLIDNEAYYHEQSNLQKSIFEKIFCNIKEMYKQHMSVIGKFINNKISKDKIN
jgi:hypothetical protein